MIVARQPGIVNWGKKKEVLILWKMFYFLAGAAKQDVELDPVVN